MDRNVKVILLIMGVLLILLISAYEFRKDPAPVDYVNPLIGTTMEGNVAPNVGVPFGMTQWTPQTSTPGKKGVPPYRYYAPLIQGFRASHWLSGGATQDYGSMTLMPIVGPLNVTPRERGSTYSHRREISTPYFYKVRLNDYNITAEMTATSHSGFLRFRFPESDSSFVIIDANAGYQPTRKNTTGDGYIRIIPEKNEIVGFDPVYRMYQGWGKPAGFSGYFVIQFRQQFDSYGIWNPTGFVEDDSTESHDRPIAYVGFRTTRNEAVDVKVGTSFTSIAEAENNLNSEIPSWNFSRIRYITKEKWEDQLDRLKVSGGSPVKKTIFYTALYHAFQLPRIISDADGSYVRFGSQHAITKFSKTQYGDFSLWDTFRAEQPLLTLLDPDRSGDMISSLINKGEQGGFLPIFPAWNNYTSEMIGDHAIPVIVDAYMKGIRTFNADTAYALMKKNATDYLVPDSEYVLGKGRRALNNYLQYGFIPLEDSVKDAFHQGEQVTRTLEYAYDDWALAQMARVLGKQNDYEKLSKRAQYFRNVFDTTTGFVRGRYANGAWAKPFQPNVRYPYITEGTPWQYSWYVPQDIPALIRLMGGEKEFDARLDTLFEQAVSNTPSFRENPYYWQGNEPDQLAPYLYDYAGEPWKTQYWVRQIMRRSYLDNAGGLPGNDDAGQMSAWYVFSAMGFYPVCPGKPVYAIGSPLFNKITLHLKGGKTFTIIAKDNSSRNVYIQSARLNGKPLNKPWISHADIMKGGILKLQMSDHPNRKWGVTHN